MKAALRAAALIYLQTHNVLTLATTGPQGLWAAAVFYVNQDFDLFFLSSPATRHGLNLGERADVAATVQEDYADWRAIKGIQLEGEVVRLAGAEQAAALARYALKFPYAASAALAPAEIAQALARMAWYRLRPVRLYFIDNSRGLGHRDEVSLSAAPLAAHRAAGRV